MSTALQRTTVVATFLAISGGALAQMPAPSPVPPSPSIMPAPLPHSQMPSPQPPALPSPSLAPMPMDAISPQLPPAAIAPEEDLTALYRRIVDDYGANRYDEALALAEQYVASIERKVGPAHLAYAGAISLQARLYQAQGRLEQAEILLRRALEIIERERGPNHAEVANELDAIAQLYQELGRLDEAEPLFKRALAINEKAVGSDPAAVGRSLNNLAWLYQEQGRYGQAEPLIIRALSNIENTLGVNHADYGRALDTLAKIYEGQGRIEDAAPIYRRAMKILADSLGPDHESVAVTSENLGGLIKSQGRLDEAEALIRRAATIKEKVFGADHPRLANALSQLGDLFRQQGKDAEAESMFRRALAIRRAAIREVPVFFATDRKQEKGAKAVAFGGNRARELTYGKATVMVTKPQTFPDRAQLATLPSDGAAINSGAHFETTEVSRLAIREIDVTPDTHEFIASARQKLESAKVFPKQVFIFVHGYNVSFENALRRTAQIAYDLNFDGAPFLFSWPSRNSVWSYTTDRESAEIAVNHLKDFIARIAEETQAAKIHLIAHSMGNVVLLGALEKIQLSKASGARSKFAEIVLHSPDVDNDRFSQLMRAINGFGANITLYASTTDRALSLSAWLWGVVGRAGAEPTVVPGVETIDVTEAGSSLLGLNHDLYATNPTIFNDMRLVLELGKHPPDERSSAFKPTMTDEGTYWLYRRLDSRVAQ